MQRFLLFCGDKYYPGGGFYDYYKDYTSAEDAEDQGRRLVELRDWDWWHVVDSVEGKIVKDCDDK